MRNGVQFKPAHTTLKVLGVLLIAFSFSMLTPIPVSIYYDNGNHFPFYLAFAITLITGVSIWLPTRHCKEQLRTRDGFVIVTLMWIFLTTFGSLPFVLADKPHTSFSAAFFETMSGLTTTGVSVLTEVDGLSEAILYYRQQLQFLGGMGIIVLGVAILPLIGVGGMQLYKAESSKPLEDEKFTPRMAKTAKALWVSYAFSHFGCVGWDYLMPYVTHSAQYLQADMLHTQTLLHITITTCCTS
jgi:trk system potassium uptake protein TrkH